MEKSTAWRVSATTKASFFDASSLPEAAEMKYSRPAKFINLITELPIKNFNLSDIDRLIQQRRENGIEPKAIIFHPEQIRQLEFLLQSQQRYMDIVESQGDMVMAYRGFPIYQTYQDNLGICHKCNFPAEEIVIMGNKLVATCGEHYVETKMIKQLELSCK